MIEPRAQITEAAVRIADAEGLEAATMRRIAVEIGAGAMSLYRYVPDRDDLLELMADRLMGEIDVAGLPSGDWRADLTRYADGLRAMWLRHRRRPPVNDPVGRTRERVTLEHDVTPVGQWPHRATPTWHVFLDEYQLVSTPAPGTARSGHPSTT